MRFPGFSGEWEQSTIGKCCNELEYGMNAAAKEFDGVNKYIRITDIDEKSSTYKNNDIVSPDGDLDDKYIVRENDILFARTGASRGKTYIYNPNDGVLYFAGFLIRANVKTHYDSKFIYQQTKLSRYNKWVNIMSARSGQPGINSQEYSTYKLFLPTIEEQQKVSAFINLLDKRIEAQNKIIEDLKKLKVAICNQLLNNKTLLNKTAPLSTFGELKNGYAFKSSTYVPNGSYNIITIANVSGDREIATDSCNTISSVPTDIQSHQILKSGDILISLTGNVGRVSLNKGNNNLLNQRVGLFVPNNSISAEFLYQILSFVQFEKSMINLAQGAAQMNIGKGDIESYQVRYSDNHQLINTISRILLDYDKKIEIENKYFQSLLSQKSYLLSNMFI